MAETPYTYLLDREVADANALAMSEPLGLMEEVVNYGSNLIPRTFDSSPRDLVASIVIFHFLRQCVVNLDSVHILLSRGAVPGTNHSLRSLLDLSLHLDWLLRADTENRARHLYVANLRLRRDATRVLIAGTPEEADFATAVGSSLATASHSADAAKQEASINAILAHADLAAIDAEFTRARGSRTYDLPWTKISGATSIWSIAQSVGRESEYRYVYSALSGVTHGSALWASVSFQKKGAVVEGIRSPEQFLFVWRMSLTLAMRAYRAVLGKYRPEEAADNFARKYAEWQPRFQKKYQVVAKPQVFTI